VLNLDDLELIQRISSGDENAFLSLYDRHASHVFALALRILGDPGAADEVTQDTFLKLWKRSDHYQAALGTVITWLLTITRHTALDHLRSEARRPPITHSLEDGDQWLDIPAAESATEESRWRSMYFAVQSLPDDQRHVIELAYYHGLSQSEIAEELKWPLGTVKTRLRAGMESLRRVWNKA